jgi:hypothetical protein
MLINAVPPSHQGLRPDLGYLTSTLYPYPLSR